MKSNRHKFNKNNGTGTAGLTMVNLFRKLYRLGERGSRARAQQFVVGRTQDVAALCDVRLKNWIKENRIELVNYRDALYGTREYQNHLKLIGSALAIG